MLDVLRAVAAVAVCAGHLLNAFYVNDARIENRTLGALALYSAEGFGLVAVVIFFVMSGFVIGSAALRRRQDNRLDWRLYFTDRFTRLYVVLVPALVLGLVWDLAGMRLFGTSGIYGARFGDVITVPVAQTTTVRAYLMNVVFLQKFFAEPAGSNSPLWTLSYEFWCYATLPVLLAPRRLVPRGVLATAGILAAYFLIQTGLGAFLLFWLCGVAVAFTIPLRDGEAHARPLAGISTAIFVSTLAASRFLNDHASRQGLVVAAGTSLFIFGLVRWWPRDTPCILSSWKTPARIAAGFSYTLYLTHYPLMVFLAAWLIKGDRWQPDGLSMVKGAAIFGTTLLYAYGVSRMTEAHTGTIRRRLFRRPAA